MHLILDGTLVHPVTRVQVEELLGGLPGVIGMTLIAGPFTSETPGMLMSFVLIAESHISLYAVGKTMFMDIFSCKPFCAEIAEQYIGKRLELEEVSKRVLVRQIGKIAWAAHV